MQVAFLGISYARVHRVVSAMSRPGSSTVLIGEPGCGKAYLARAAAYELELSSGSGGKFFVVNDAEELLESYLASGALGPGELSALILQDLHSLANGSEIVMVALNIDQYSSDCAAVLEHLIRARSVRFIGTAQEVVGAADRLARDPSVQQLAIEPLTIDEAEQMLAQLFGVSRVSQQPLQRWYQSTRGNSHALATLALSAARRGIVHRVRQTAWIAARDDRAPVELITQLGELTAQELDVLEIVAYAAPMQEPGLYQLLDADAVTSLMNRQILTVCTLDSGISALTTRLPVLTAALRTHLSPVRRTQLAQTCYQALLSDDSTLTTATKLRLVRFGMEAGAELPPHWLWQAMSAMSHSGDLRFVLRLAVAATHHETAERSIEATMRAADLAHFLGDAPVLDDMLSKIDEMLADRSLIEALPFEMQFHLAMSSICFRPAYYGHPDLAMQAFSEWEGWWRRKGIDATQATRVCRMRVLAVNGRQREALEIGSSLDSNHKLEDEWRVAPARTFEALLRAQRGEFKQALLIAETTRRIVMLHQLSPTISGDLEGFAVFFAHWARGTTLSARQVLLSLTGPVREDLEAVHAHTGLVDLAIALFSMQEARWYDASEVAERLVSALAVNDPLGVTPFAHAIHALALAALGSDESAHEALMRSEQRVAGISSVLHGYLTMIQLRAKHWLRDPDLEQHALALAEWARNEDIPLIELKALDLVAHQTSRLDAQQLKRAGELAEQVDAPIGDAVLTHIQALTSADPATHNPEERLLSELGIWMPLPPVRELTGREREIALFTALGYSSKHVAERLHLSARTIETHLAHVYTKLGVEGRDGLRRWFSQQREAR